jgi:hypothetical protein
MPVAVIFDRQRVGLYAIMLNDYYQIPMGICYY